MTPAPTTSEIRDQIIAMLREQHPRPATTREVASALYQLVRAYPGAIYQQLIVLTQDGRIERADERHKGRPALWRYVEAS